MIKILLSLILVFFMYGCSQKTPFISADINQVAVVKYAPYFKHHRAYFARDNLQTIGNKKYKFLHNSKKNDLGVLLHYKNKYILYNMSQPEQKPYIIRVKQKKYPLHKILKVFASKGFKPVKHVADVGYITSISYKRYKDIKTLLIEVKDYSRLQARYKKAIKKYNPNYIKHIKTQLPKSLILYYYTYYKKHTKSKSKIHQLQIIGEKLLIDKVEKLKKPQKTISKVAKSKCKKPKSTLKIKPTPVIKNKKTIVPVDDSSISKENTNSSKSNIKSYNYYRYDAPLEELSSYIISYKSILSDNQYASLKLREKRLEEEKLLNEGTLEELIAAYKINKKSTYKERIMILLKEKQDSN